MTTVNQRKSRRERRASLARAGAGGCEASLFIESREQRRAVRLALGRSAFELQSPDRLVRALRPLLRKLATQGVLRLDVFRYRRPGEPWFMQAILVTAEGRDVVGTPDIRHLPLEQQVPDLLRQLAAWSRGDAVADDEF